MKNKKILIIIPIILVILLLIGTGGFAFIYFQTDMFKSPKQLFFKYVGKTFETSNDFDYDKFLEDYKSANEKSYKSNGEINLEVNTDINEISDIAKSLNKAKLNYNLNSIPKEQKSYFSLEAIYDNKEITKFEGLQTQDNYGLKCADLYDKYIYVENNNLKSLARKFGINSSSFPDRIENIDVYDLLYVSKDTRKEIKDTYYSVLDEKLDKKMFTTEKNVETTVNGESVKTDAYSLTLTDAEFYDILISILDTLKNDDTTLDLIIDKSSKSNIEKYIKQAMLSYSDSNQEVTFNKDSLKDMIQNEIDNLQKEKSTISGNSTTKLTVYTSKRKTVKLELTSSNSSAKISIDITKNKNSNNIISLNSNEETILKVEYTNSKEKNINKLNGTISIMYDDTTIPINFNIESGKQSNKVNVKLTLPLEDTLGTSQKTFTEDILIEFNSETSGELGKGTNNNTSYLSISSGNNLAKLNLKSDITYTDDVSIIDLSSDNSECLNTMSASEIETMLQTIVTNFQKVLPEKMELLGIDSSAFNTNDETDEDDIDDNIFNENDDSEEQENDSKNASADTDDDNELIPFL